VKSESARRFLEEHFISLMDETEQRKKRFDNFKQRMETSALSEGEKKELYGQFIEEEREYSRLSRTKLSSARYERIKLIGRGGFGDVWLVQDKITSELYALKILRKSDIILKDQLINVRTERDILSSCVNPWIVRLHFSFQDEQRLYLVLEYLAGGDLMSALIKKQKFSEGTARFFAGEIAMALHSVHASGLLHTDLKLENVLIAADGHIRLTDFGLSRNYSKQDQGFHKLLGQFQELMIEARGPSEVHHERGTAYGTCGYTAPEIFSGAAPSTASDIWSLGVILYEMLYGFAPFMGKSQQETAMRVIHFRRSLRFPHGMGVSDSAVDLLKHLLCDAEVRLTYEQICEHPFFKGFHFGDPRQNFAPMVPVIRRPGDASNFDDIEVEQEEVPWSLENDDLAKFAFLGYTYKQKPHNNTLAKLGAQIFA
jgi:serine/threonine protein kinase